jgi:hypothetical protein
LREGDDAAVQHGAGNPLQFIGSDLAVGLAHARERRAEVLYLGPHAIVEEQLLDPRGRDGKQC